MATAMPEEATPKAAHPAATSAPSKVWHPQWQATIAAVRISAAIALRLMHINEESLTYQGVLDIRASCRSEARIAKLPR